MFEGGETSKLIPANKLVKTALKSGIYDAPRWPEFHGKMIDLARQTTNAVIEYFLPPENTHYPQEKADIFFGREIDKLFNITKGASLNSTPLIMNNDIFLDPLYMDSFFSQDAGSIVTILLKQGFSKTDIGKVLTAHLAKKILFFSYLNENKIILSDIDNFSKLSGPEKFEIIAFEISRYGFENVDRYYNEAQKINKANDDGVLLQMRTELRKSFRDQPEIFDKLETAIARKLLFRPLPKELDFEKKLSEQYKLAFKKAIEYMKYCFPKAKRAEVAANIVNVLRLLRDITSHWTPLSTADSYENNMRFWGATRLGRLFNETERKRLGISKRTNRLYSEHIFDVLLRTKAADHGFSIVNKDIPDYRNQPERVLYNTIKNLLDVNRYQLKENGNLKVMILVNDNNYIKIDLGTGATDREIMSKIMNAKPVHLNLTPDQRYELFRDAYKHPKHRSKRYKKLYSYGKNDGDYIIRLTTKGSKISGNNKGPTSLFIANNHKAIIDINLNHPQGIEFTMEAAHQKFDGDAFHPVFKQMYNRFVQQYRHDQTIPRIHLIENAREASIYEENFPYFKREYRPLMDATGSLEIDDTYEDLPVTVKGGRENVKLNILRSAAICLANGIYDFQILYKSPINPYSQTQYYDNVQPVVVSFWPIKEIYDSFKEHYLNPKKGLKVLSADEKKNVREFVERTNEAIIWARRGFSTASTLAAAGGRLETPLRGLTEKIYEGTKLLTKANAMISNIVNFVEPSATSGTEQSPNPNFETAESSNYQALIDLLNSRPHLGALGIYSERAKIPGKKKSNRNRETKAAYTVKKTPSQIQYAIKKVFLESSDFYLKKIHKEKTAFVLNRVLKSWIKLSLGEVDLKDNLIDFDNHEVVLREAFEELQQEDVFGLKNLCKLGIVDHPLKPSDESLKYGHWKLQEKLNEIFVNDAKAVLNAEKIKEEHETLIAFFESIYEPEGPTFTPLQLEN